MSLVSPSPPVNLGHPSLRRACVDPTIPLGVGTRRLPLPFAPLRSRRRSCRRSWSGAAVAGSGRGTGDELAAVQEAVGQREVDVGQCERRVVEVESGVERVEDDRVDQPRAAEDRGPNRVEGRVPAQDDEVFRMEELLQPLRQQLEDVEDEEQRRAPVLEDQLPEPVPLQLREAPVRVLPRARASPRCLRRVRVAPRAPAPRVVRRRPLRPRPAHPLPGPPITPATWLPCRHTPPRLRPGLRAAHHRVTPVPTRQWQASRSGPRPFLGVWRRSAEISGRQSPPRARRGG